MKTQEEIEQLAESQYGTEIGSIRGSNPYDLEGNRKNGFIQGYTQCQQDMADNSIKFALWLNENRWYNFDKQYQKWCYTFEGGTSLPRRTYEKDFMKTSAELYEKYINSLTNKTNEK